MKKTILYALIPLVMATSAAFGTVTLSFNDNSGTANAGTYNSTSTFSFDVSLTFTTPPTSSPGISYWFEVPTALAPFLSITSESYFTFTIGTDGELPKTFTDSSGADAGFMSDKSATQAGDLGATTTGTAPVAGTYMIATISFSLSGAPAGTYTLKTTDLSPKVSELSGSDFSDNPLSSQANYIITVVPEPGTLSLLGLGGLGSLGLTILRARRRS
jgi:PEP-CTERM motif